MVTTTGFKASTPQLLRSAQSGFTLTELLATVIISAILAAIAVPASLNLWNRIQLDNAQDLLLNAMRTAQTNAKRYGGSWVVIVTNGNGADQPVQIDVQPSTGAADCGPRRQCSRTFVADSRIQVETTFNTTPPGDDIAIFNSKGEARNDNGQFVQGRFVAFRASQPTVTRCVFVSTILGGMRSSTDANDSSCVVP
jgi:prepilin-type N-terminal cleavage/methylation domain-containing protein